MFTLQICISIAQVATWCGGENYNPLPLMPVMALGEWEKAGPQQETIQYVYLLDGKLKWPPSKAELVGNKVPGDRDRTPALQGV